MTGQQPGAVDPAGDTRPERRVLSAVCTSCGEDWDSHVQARDERGGEAVTRVDCAAARAALASARPASPEPDADDPVTTSGQAWRRARAVPAARADADHLNAAILQLLPPALDWGCDDCHGHCRCDPGEQQRVDAILAAWAACGWDTRRAASLARLAARATAPASVGDEPRPTACPSGCEDCGVTVDRLRAELTDCRAAGDALANAAVRVRLVNGALVGIDDVNETAEAWRAGR